MKKITFLCFLLLSNPGFSQCWKSIAVGAVHTIALKDDGTLWSWGLNSSGQLGDGTTVDKKIPVQVGSASDWKAISAGNFHNLAIKNDGTLWSWGINSNGQLGIASAIAYKNTPTQICNSSDWLKIAACSLHSLAIKTDGTLWAWGSNANGEVGDGTASNDRNTPIHIGTATDWSFVTGGDYHSMGIKTDGTLWGWGLNLSGQLGDGTQVQKNAPVQVSTDTDWMNLSCGESHNLALKTNGSLWVWGLNGNGQLGTGNTNTSYYVPTAILPTETWLTIAAAGKYSTAVKNDHTLWVWGRNNFGQLGDGTTTTALSPFQIGADTDWKENYAGGAHKFSQKTNGMTHGNGLNSSGQLGNNSTSNLPSLTPLFSCTLGMDIPTDYQRFSLYPNPCSNILHIKNETNDGISNLQIINMTGQLVLEKNNPENAITTEALPEGMYLVKITSGNSNYVTKVIKQK